MISRFVLKNLSTLEEVVFGQGFDCDFIYESGGVDWGSIPANHNVYNYPNQIGDSISSSKVKNRDVSITAFAFYVLSDGERELYGRDEWLSYGYEKIKEKKELLNRIINPLHDIRITIGDYYIEGRPGATPKYGITEADNNLYFCKFLIELFCSDPMFKKITQMVNVVSGDYGAFFFPLAFMPIGNIMGVRNDFLMLSVENEGNIAIGGKVILTAKDIIENPSVTNENNGQTFKIYKTMQAGERIEIYTIDGSSKGVFGTINGVVNNYIQYWDFNNNDWIKFNPGTSIVSYSSDNGMETLMDVQIEINPAKYGLEEM